MMNRRDRARGNKKQQSHNDIKKLRRENEQLRREIWCLREEYDKLEEILKSQKSREDSENDEDFSEECTTGSSQGDEDEDEEDEISDVDDSIEKSLKPESIQEELLENAENQKLSSEKMNSSIHRLHVEFDQLSTVPEEDETKREKITSKKEERDLIKPETTETNEMYDKGRENYLTGHTLNWIYSPECPVLPSMNDQSVYHPQSPSTQHLIPSSPSQVPRLGWEAIFDVKSPTNSLVSPGESIPSVCDNQKTSPDICVSGAVANQLHNSHSSDNLLSNPRDNLDNLEKTLWHSCQELKSNLFREENAIKGGLAAKSLPDNSRDSPKAFRSQLRVRLTQPLDKPPEVPPQMPRLDCTLCPTTLPSDRRHRRLIRQMQRQEYQATSFEHPNPQTLNLPVSGNPFLPKSDGGIYKDVGYLPGWQDVLPPPRVDIQTQTQSQSPTPSDSSGQERKDKDKDKVKGHERRKAVKKERVSTPSVDGKRQRRGNSQASKGRTSSRSQSVVCGEGELKSFRDTIAGGIEAERELRKSSMTNEKVPWCACWGNGCF
ncbi:uncharacterized protein [Fopius arisanus]|uniref:Uncharacterized protein isoform X2 n=1 Tax=Fopius arisanus TaxID=64838 RepID=A0A0C9PH94_9HYME|nr:PREDICTED: uncharacterized protein LOC105273856 isoform X2 [Fopius arisanus]XP_011314857.1 PREDICTED: uncharacterized protein LOC105273856 isoform X2 [Fopius arisanus]XP_011314864.1 PREDICTED: uncharacterized protein LOC105273856 isoform X2 [Fopius arisanus]